MLIYLFTINFFVSIYFSFLSSLSSTSSKIMSYGFGNLGYNCSNGFFFINGLEFLLDKNLFEIC